MNRARMLLVLAAAIGLLVTARAGAAPACTVTWDGPAAGAWETAGNWDTNVVPSASDHACVPAGNTVTHSFGTTSILTLQAPGAVVLSGGTLTLTSTADGSTAVRLDITGGFLAGAGDLELSGQMLWSGGRMLGEGTTRVLPGATLTHSNFVHLAEGRTLENEGLLAMTANQPIATFSPAGRLVNTGTVRKSTSTGEARIDVPLVNAGLIEATAGSLNLDGGSGGEASSGDFGAAGAAAGSVRFGGGTHVLGDGAGLLGGVTMQAGTVEVVDAATAAASGANALTGSFLDGPGDLEIAGQLAWSGGRMLGEGTTRVLPGGTLTHSNFVHLAEGRTLENDGLLEMTANQPIATFAPAGRLVNDGTVLKSTSAGEARIDVPVVNAGLIEATAGALNLDGGSGGVTSSGDFGAAGAAASSVRFGGGTHVLGDGARLLGGSNIESGVVNVGGGTAVASGATMTGGRLGGPGVLSISGAFTWSGGTMGDAGRTRVEPAGTLSLLGNMTLAGSRVLENAGTIDAGDGFLSRDFSGTPLLDNTAAGTLRKPAGSGTRTISPAVRNAGTVHSQSGTLRLDEGAGSAHTGSFEGASESARVVFEDGTHTLAAGGRLLGVTEFGGADVVVPGGATLDVPDTLFMTAGTLAGDAEITGTLRWLGGTQLGPGTTTVAPAGRILVNSLQFTCGVTLRDGRRLVNDGTVTLLRHVDLSSFGDEPPVIVNRGTLEIDDSDDAGCGDFHGITGNPLVQNTGTIDRHGGTGTATVRGVLDNDGTVLARSGGLELSSTDEVFQSGSFETTGAGSSIAFDDGEFLLAPGASLAGNLVVGFAELVIPDGMTVPLGADDVLTLDGGTIGGPGSLAIAGELVWRDGSLDGHGTTVIEPGGEATVGGEEFAFAEVDGGHALVNRGQMVLLDGIELSLRRGGSILNDDTLALRGDAVMSGDGAPGFGYETLLHNAGRLTKADAGVATVGTAMDNDGTIEVTGGTLVAEHLLNRSDDLFGFGEGTLTGGSYEVRDATLQLRGPLAVNAARLVLDGAGAQVAATDFGGDPATDALAGLRRIAGAGELELAGGKSLTTGPLSNAGVVRVGPGSELDVAGDYRQTAGAVLRTTVDSAPPGFGRVDAAGLATLAGRLDVISPFRPAAGTVFHVVQAASRSGTFGTVTGADLGGGLHYDVDYADDGARLRASTTAGPGLRSERAAPGAAAPPPVVEPEPPAADGAVTLDDRALTARGPWARRGRYVVARRRGAALVARRVSGRALAIRARTCRRCGSVRVSWAGRTRTVSLRSRRPGLRTLRVMRFRRVRTATVRMRTTSARRVAVDALVVSP